MTLFEKFIKIGDEFHARTRNLSQAQALATTTAFETFIDKFVCLVEDVDGAIDMEKLAAVRMAASMGSQLLDATISHTRSEIQEAMFLVERA